MFFDSAGSSKTDLISLLTGLRSDSEGVIIDEDSIRFGWYGLKGCIWPSLWWMSAVLDDDEDGLPGEPGG